MPETLIKDKDGRTLEDKKLRTIGTFQYGYNKVTLQVSADGRYYAVKIWKGIWLKDHTRPLPTSVHPLQGLTAATKYFQERVLELCVETTMPKLLHFIQTA